MCTMNHTSMTWLIPMWRDSFICVPRHLIFDKLFGVMSKYEWVVSNTCITFVLVWQCVAVCCSVLQCIAVCCSVLQCAAVCCSVLQYVAVCCSVLQCAAVCCSVLQCVAVCCSALQCVAVLLMSLYEWVLQCVAVCCSALQCVAVCCTELQCYLCPCSKKTKLGLFYAKEPVL